MKDETQALTDPGFSVGALNRRSVGDYTGFRLGRTKRVVARVADCRDVLLF